MNRIDRLYAIVNMLQSRSLVTAQQIATRFSVSLRTVYRDIKALDESGIPIVGNQGFGYSLVDGFKLPPLMFTQTEAFTFLAAEKLVNELTDSGSSEHFKSGMDKIRAVMQFVDKSTLESMEPNLDILKTYKQKMSYSSNNIQSLLQSINKKSVLKIAYLAGNKQDTTERNVEPVGIFFSKIHWYLVAFCQTRGEYRTFRVDRIQTVIKLNTSFTKQHPPLKDCLENIMKKQELEEVVIKLKKNDTSVMDDDKYYYGLFSEKEEGDSIEFFFLTFSLDKFARWYLSFADMATIIRPNALKDKVKKIVESISI